MNAAEHYSYRVAWSAEDQEFVGTVLELPSLSWLESEPGAAFAGIQLLAAEVVNDLLATGEQVPEPISERNYSGKFQVRIPPAVHRRLAEEAAEQGISMNRLVSHKLSA
ncbi:type II toxin-antitoxin system HicB family antitoxin [Isoptericola sp. NEAU-Y5]|uniref:Type II toxin-antitoxin system HicB family antitoxin n=1 Tax=Isoptericola luteus TaxID=2879484 RepID=A0ABS7ZNF6_9MICO|nr:type II toxin-antitoxin system HicB family antitoxin [Isoptericola sp. NEAU-Y5]MCA5895179.1 type II toxin-antitoxin system HicB family antitoxin [Isoptericola sp. NEAU-Y5]